MVMKEHVTQCNAVARLCVFNSFWTLMELHGTEEEDQVLATQTILVFRMNVLLVLVFLWPHL